MIILRKQSVTGFFSVYPGDNEELDNQNLEEKDDVRHNNYFLF